MDYINYVKQSPMQGMVGMWGGTQGALMNNQPEGGGGGGGGFNYGGGRGLFTGGALVYWSMESTSNASSFGSCTFGSDSAGLCGYSGNRAVFAGPSTADMLYVTTTSTGNAQNFGSMSPARYATTGTSNGPRGVWGGGQAGGNLSNMQYIEVATTSSSSSFGELSLARHGRDSVSGGVRGIFANGQDPHTNSIEYVTIANTGNASNFGNTTTARTFGTGSNSDPGSGQNRGVFMAGFSGVDDHCDYITCSTTGNATDWGELTQGHGYRCGSGTSGTKAMIAGGSTGGANITYVTVDTAGSSSNAGDLTSPGNSGAGACGNA